jgi:bacterioferritin
MPGHPRLIGLLQRALDHEFGAAQQFTLQAEQADALGLRELAAGLRASAREELGHAGAFAARLLTLGAAPRAGLTRALPIGRTREELLRYGLATEAAAVRLYEEARRFCERIGEAGHGALFGRILEEEVRHYRELEEQIDAPSAAPARR